MKNISELRQDIVSGDWIVIATGRAKRPHDFQKRAHPALHQAKTQCPFEARVPVAYTVYAAPARVRERGWLVQVVPNKYPSFSRTGSLRLHRKGLYHWREGVGTHDVVVFRDHHRSLARFTDQEVEVVMRAYQERFRALAGERGIAYVSLFHNHGRDAGATIVHPHSQIIGVPVIPPDVGRSIKGSAAYVASHRACVHCVVLGFERREKERMVYENERFFVYAPFASRTAFELRILPKTHSAHFEKMSVEDRAACANALRVALAKLYRGLNDPDYNFFLHTAPAGDPKDFGHYHWHFEILPKTAIWAGFEIGTGIEVSVIAPEKAAEFLRKIKV